jgi:hypothetical protein
MQITRRKARTGDLVFATHGWSQAEGESHATDTADTAADKVPFAFRETRAPSPDSARYGSTGKHREIGE